MKIFFVRGPHLNPWELQTYVPFQRKHAFVAIGGDYQFYKGPFSPHGVSIQKASLWGSSLGRLHPQLFVLANRLLSWTMGQSFGFYNLAKVVEGADILHPPETFSTMTYQCLEIRQRRRCKVVATVWENLSHMGETHPIRHARKRRALRELDGFLAITETSKRMLLAEGAPAERIEVIPMAVDLSHFKPAPRDPSIKGKVVLFVGRLVPEKGVAELLAAIPEVLKTVPKPLRFYFVGAGPMADAVKQARTQFPDCVELIPFAPYEELPRIHNMADVFVLPSKPAPKWEEQFGYVLAESMACGKAIVTTRSGSIPDVVGDAAVLVTPGSSSELASALVRLLNSDAERTSLGEAAQRRALEHFDAEKNSRRIEAFYERVLARPS